ncbi:hypothetical protein QVD17_35350 [Tagetes erecta]|uniref:BZIP domain-containing protein n=1 Tax=Tagetes erecta TaxID=13708 RepID=A0AAD8JZB3_TARER|nr:hypothetical protein QVD17_35350 [Tagetes erecta]
MNAKMNNFDAPYMSQKLPSPFTGITPPAELKINWKHLNLGINCCEMINNSHNHNGNLLPSSCWDSNFQLNGNNDTNWVETDTDSSSHFSQDISKMPDTPRKYTGHRRAHSEIITLPDDISFDSDLGIVGCFNGPEETEEDLFSMYLDMDSKLNSSSETSGLDVESSRTSVAPPATLPVESYVHSSSDRPKAKHQHSLSMDCSTTFDPEDASLTDDAKKTLSATKLAELAIVDPKRAKRIWANRQSAARSKERKMRYIAELEREVQILQTEATSLSAQLNLLQRDVHGLTIENNELKLRLQTMEQQGHLQDALTDTLKKEVHHLKLLTGQSLTNGGPMVNFPPLFGPNQRFNPNNQAMHTMLTAQQFQQLQIQPRNQHHHHPFQPPQLQFQNQQQSHQFQQHHHHQHQHHG